MTEAAERPLARVEVRAREPAVEPPPEPVEVRVQPVDARALRCPFCHEVVANEGEPRVSCETCSAVHHRACWVEAGSCSACRATLSIPRIRPRSHRRWLYGALAFALALDGGAYYYAHRRPHASKPQTYLSDPEPWAQRGEERIESGNYEGARSDFDTAIQLAPENAVLRVQRGRVRAALKDFSSAIMDYDRAIELDSRSFWAWNNRGCVCADLGDFKGARADLTRALELDSTQIDTIVKRAEVEERLGDWKAAAGDYAHVLELSPANAAARRAFVQLCRNQANDDWPLDVLALAAKLDPDRATAWDLLGRAYCKCGDWTRAVEATGKAVKLNSGNSYMHQNHAYALRRHGDLKAAAEECRLAVALNPRFPGAWIEGARQLLEIGEPVEALSFYEKALELGTKDPAVWLECGRLHAQIGYKEDAIDAVREALRLDPTNTAASAELDRLLKSGTR